MIDATKLESWMPILQHPKHGKEICDAAGVYARVAPDGATVIEFVHPYAPPIYVYYWHESVLAGFVCAALAFGTLAVIADSDDDDKSEVSSREKMILDALGDPHRVLALAYRRFGIGGDE